MHYVPDTRRYLLLLCCCNAFVGWTLLLFSLAWLVRCFCCRLPFVSVIVVIDGDLHVPGVYIPGTS